MIDPQLAGKTVLVTGANHGIGAATAKTFAMHGAAVFIQYLRLAPPTTLTTEEAASAAAIGSYHARRSTAADELVHAIRRTGGRADAFEADLTDPAVIPLIFDHAEAALGAVDVLVNNAAHSAHDTFVASTADQGAPLGRITPESHDRHFAVNSRAVALLMAEYARRQVGRDAAGGSVINVSTDAASGFPGEVSYGASKYAMESYSRAAARELGPYGITVNVVSPGPVQTGWIPPDLEERLVSDIPLGRLGQPEDVADVIVFLASEQARWLTGQVLYVGGGHRMG